MYSLMCVFVAFQFSEYFKEKKTFLVSETILIAYNIRFSEMKIEGKKEGVKNEQLKVLMNELPLHKLDWLG